MDFDRFRVKRDTAGSLEIERIIGIPIEEMLTPEECEEISRLEVQGSYFDEGFRLLSTQCAGIYAYDKVGGLLANIGVGRGKTLISLMIADRALHDYGIDKSILLVPPQVYPQLTVRDIPWARRRVGLRVPFILLGGRSRTDRERLAKSGKKGCYIMPYSLLSTRDTDLLLNTIKPGCVILDEAHNVKNPRAARTRRLMRYLTAHSPQVCAMSGTLTRRSIRDYGHLMAFALRDGSPLPLEPNMIDQWAAALDADADPGEAQTGPMRPLIFWFRSHWPDEDLPTHVAGYRKAYQRRLITAPGVVSTGDADIGVSLIVENLPASYQEHEGYDELKRLIDQVEELWKTPSGDEIEYGFHKWRYLFELTSGFYHHLRWPTVPELMRHSPYNKLTEREVEVFLEKAQEHHEALNAYHRDLRQWIKFCARPGLDTPFQIGHDMHLHGEKNVGWDLYDSWREAKDLEFEDMPERLSEPILVCDYKLRHAVEWGRKHGRGLMWFHHRAVGRWLAEMLKEEGLEAEWCPSESDRRGMDSFVIDPANKGKLLVISMNGHGTGKNMQHFQDQLLVQFPRDSSLIEQVIGRTHRTGQEADELTVHTNNSLPFDDFNMAACLVDTIYQQQTMDDPKKLLLAAYNPLPRLYPEEFLRERGFRDVKQLSAAARAKLQEKFGKFQEGR